MVFNSKLMLRGAFFIALLSAVFFFADPHSLIGAACLTAAFVIYALAMSVLPVDYYPVVTRQVFRDVKTFEEFRDAFIEGVDEDRKRIIWYVYNMSPNDYLNFIRLTTEIREAANDEGMRRLTQHMQRKP